jgi:hypothetical protein
VPSRLSHPPGREAPSPHHKRHTSLGRPSAHSSHMKRDVSEVFDHVLLSLPPNTELEQDDIAAVFDYPRDLHDHYDIGERIGSGSFGVVRSCTQRRTGIKYAVKGAY